jgi:chemotaxis protein MotB
MSYRRRKQHATSHERWLVSYADFITLLFAFFVVLYASSQADKQKMGRLAAAIGAAFSQLGAMPGQTMGPPLQNDKAGGANSTLPRNAEELARIIHEQKVSVTKPGEQDLTPLRRALEKSLLKEIQNRSVAVYHGPEGLVISLREMGFYDSGSAELRSDAKPAVDRIVEVLRGQSCRIRVEGHTDNVPIHTREFNSNWELSTARATSMIRQFVTVYGIAPNRLSAAGYGEFHPIANNDSEESRRLNRRLDIVILSALPPQAGTGNSANPSTDDKERSVPGR